MSYLRHISCSGQSSEFVDRISFCKTSCLIGEKWEENVRSGKKKNKQATLYWDTYDLILSKHYKAQQSQ